MKNEEYLIESSLDSIEQTFKNGVAYYNTAILLLEKYNEYNFFVDEDLEPDKLIDKYTQMNVIFTNFAFAYENLMKYLLLKNRIISDPSVQKEQLWGRWIFKHGISQLYDLASDQENYKIHNFAESFLKIMNISRHSSTFKLLANKALKGTFINLYAFEQNGIDLLFELETWSSLPHDITNEKLLNFIVDNDELFVKIRYSGQNKTNYNFLSIYYFIVGVYDYTNIIHSNAGNVPNNIEREYIKYKIYTPKIKFAIMKYYSEEEIKKLTKIITDDSLLIRILIGPEIGLKYYSIEDIESLIESDEIFKDEHYLFLAFILGLKKDNIIEQKKQGKNIKEFIDFVNSQEIKKAEEKNKDDLKDSIIKI